MNLIDLEEIDDTSGEPEKIPQQPQRHSIVHSINDLARRHPIPLVLLSVAPWIGLFINAGIAGGLCVGAGLYVLAQVVDQAADEVLGEVE